MTQGQVFFLYHFFLLSSNKGANFLNEKTRGRENLQSRISRRFQRVSFNHSPRRINNGDEIKKPFMIKGLTHMIALKFFCNIITRIKLSSWDDGKNLFFFKMARFIWYNVLQAWSNNNWIPVFPTLLSILISLFQRGYNITPSACRYK